MQLRILFSVTAFALSLVSLAQSVVIIDHTNKVAAFEQINCIGLWCHYTPLVRRLLQITARKKKGHRRKKHKKKNKAPKQMPSAVHEEKGSGIGGQIASGVANAAAQVGTNIVSGVGIGVGSQAGYDLLNSIQNKGQPPPAYGGDDYYDDYRGLMDYWWCAAGNRCKGDPGGYGLDFSETVVHQPMGNEDDAWRQSMDCWCAGERCNCDVGRSYDGCVRILDNQLTYMAHCSTSAPTQPRTYSCQSDGMDEHDGQMLIRNTAYYRAMCPLADVPECQGARLLAMECWCYNTGDCLCGHDKDEQRTFNCISNDRRNNSLPLAP